MSSSASASHSGANPLTVVVFKDSRVARTFQLPSDWLPRLGWFIGLLSSATVVAIGLAAKYYWQASHSSPGRVNELQGQLNSLKAELSQAQSEVHAPVSAPTQAMAQPIQTSVAPAVTVTVTAPPAPATGSSGPALAFTAFPAKVLPVSADPKSAPVSIENLKMNWQGSKLNLKFDLQYMGTDGGTQNGHIVILARGPEVLLAQPEGVFNDSSESALISPDRGEYFSVSRFRETNAEFGPVASRDAIQTLEIFVMSQSGQMLIDQKVKVGGGKK